MPNDGDSSQASRVWIASLAPFPFSRSVCLPREACWGAAGRSGFLGAVVGKERERRFRLLAKAVWLSKGPLPFARGDDQGAGLSLPTQLLR